MPTVVNLLEAKLELAMSLQIYEACFAFYRMVRIVEHVLFDIPLPFAFFLRS